MYISYYYLHLLITISYYVHIYASIQHTYINAYVNTYTYIHIYIHLWYLLCTCILDNDSYVSVIDTIRNH